MAYILVIGYICLQYIPFTKSRELFPIWINIWKKAKNLTRYRTDPDIKVSATYKDYYTLLNKRLEYLENVLQNFKMKCLTLINKDREYFQYNSGDLVFFISPLTSKLSTSSRKVIVKHVGPLVIYEIVDPHNYLLMTIDEKLLKGLFELERLKPTVIKMDKGNVSTLSALKRVMNLDISLWTVKIITGTYFKSTKSPPNIQNIINNKLLNRNIENIVPKIRPLFLKPSKINGSIDSRGNVCQDTVLTHRPPPNLPPKCS